MTKKEEHALTRLMKLLDDCPLVEPTTQELRHWLFKRTGPITIDKFDPASADLVRKAARMKRRADGRRQFQSALAYDEEGETKRVWIQMPLASDEKRRSVVEMNVGIAIAQMKTCNLLAEEATELGTQIPLPFPDLREAASGQ